MIDPTFRAEVEQLLGALDPRDRWDELATLVADRAAIERAKGEFARGESHSIEDVTEWLRTWGSGGAA